MWMTDDLEEEDGGRKNQGAQNSEGEEWGTQRWGREMYVEEPEQ